MWTTCRCAWRCVAKQLGCCQCISALLDMQELIAMQASGPREIGFFGTRNMGFSHQNLVEVLSYAMVLTVRSMLGSLIRETSSRP